MKAQLPDEAATEALGQSLARALGPAGPQGGARIWLQGELGAGKTALSRSLLRALGETGPVKSPTYTLMEPYEFPDRPCCHMDLYRLADAEELAFLGIRDLDDPATLLLVEWPDKGAGFLPQADLIIQLSHADPGRKVAFEALTERGRQILMTLAADPAAPVLP